MNMKAKNPLELIYKYKWLIVVLTLVIGLSASFILAQKQSYTATAIIEYTNAGAVDGKAPDNTEIDTSEIYCTEVMTEVFERMGMTYDVYNLDKFRSKVKVGAIQTEEEKAIQEAKNEKGEEPETKPTKYVVTLTLNKKDAADPQVMARQIMDNMLDVFQRVYAERHIGARVVINDIVGTDETNYDYIEAIEAIEENVVSTLEILSNYTQSANTFRSTETGYSFGDLYREYELIQNNKIPDLYACILTNKLTKNAEILLAKYEQRIENYKIDLDTATKEIDDIKQIIETYVAMMRESNNTQITHEYILDEVYDAYYQKHTQGSDPVWVRPDETVEYDVLLDGYVANRTSYEHTLIEIAYCQYIIETYSGKMYGEDTGVVLDKPTTVGVDSKSVDTAADVEMKLKNLSAELDELYDKLAKVNTEYNEYAGAMNVGLVSTIIVTANLKVLLYSIIALVALAIIISMAVIFFSRVAEIMDYYMFVDQKLQIRNRAACDRYLEKNQKRLLRREFVALSINIANIRGKNEAYGREECDTMIRKFAEILKRVLPADDASCILAVNGLGQFVAFIDGITEFQATEYMNRISDEVGLVNPSLHCPIEYSYGIAEAGKEEIYRLRDLMLRAINKANNRTDCAASRSDRT